MSSSINGGTIVVLAGETQSGLIMSGNGAWIDAFGSSSAAAVTSNVTLLNAAHQDVGALWQNGNIISRGPAVAIDTQIGNNAYQWVGSGGTEIRSIVSGGGTMYLDSGAQGQGARILSNGTAQVMGGAMLGDAFVSGANSYLATYGSAGGTAVTSGATLQDGGRQDVGVLWNGNSVVSRGPALADDTHIGNSTYQWVDSGGTAVRSVVSAGGTLRVGSSGLVQNATILSGGAGNVSAGGVISGSLVSSGGVLTIQNGGTGVNDQVLPGGNAVVQPGGMEIVSGGVVSGITLQAGASAFVQAGGTAIDFVASGNGAWVATYGSAAAVAVTNNLTLLSGARQDVGALWQNGTIVSRGPAVANDTQIGNNTYQWLGSGGTGIRSIVSAGGTMLLDSGAVGQGARVLSNGIAQVMGGAILSDAFVSGANSYLATYGNAGGTAVTSGATLQDGGRQDVGALWNGNSIVARGPARADDTHIGNNSYQWVASGGTANRSVVSAGGALRIDFSGLAQNAMILSGGTGNVSAGGMVSGSIVSSGGALTIQNGGTGLNDQVLPGGTGIVQAGGRELVSGGVGSGITLQAGASAVVQPGGTAVNFVASGAGAYLATYGNAGGSAVTSGATLHDGARQDVGELWSGNSVVSRGPARADDTHIGNNTYQWIASGGTAVRSVVSAGGALQIGSSGLAQSAAVQAGASAVVAGGGTFADGQIALGAFLSGSAGAFWGGTNTIAGVVSGGTVISQGEIEIVSGGTARDLSIASGGSLQIDAGGALVGLALLSPGASATLDGNAGGTINLGGNGYARLTFTGTTSPTSIISGFNGESPTASDQIVLRDVPKTEILGVNFPDDNTIEFVLTGDRVLRMNVPGAGKKPTRFDLSDGPGNSTVFAVCFLAGTLIRTPDGERAVETIRPGDLVYVYHHGYQEVQRVTWTGQHGVTRTESAGFESTRYPVRIGAGAFGEGMPYKDLLLTPEHCLFIDGALVPARMLVNGRSIIHDTSLKSYSYHHIETETHAVVMADGLLGETYLDTGNRNGLALSAGSEARLSAAEKEGASGTMAAPLDVSRAFVEPIWNRLAQRAGVKHPCQTENDALPHIHLRTDAGDVLHPVRVNEGGYHVFHVPGENVAVYICSPAVRPNEAIGPFVDDRRLLGVLVGEMTLYGPDGANSIDVCRFLHHARGWHDANEPAQRWTNGCGVLPLGSSAGAGKRVLALQILAAAAHAEAREALAS